MPDSISRETREQLEALCRKISVSHKIDVELRRELYGHMEDRLLAHMNGEIPLTEQDAFILVREHFGDPAMIKEQIQEVHAEEAASYLGRRLLAAFAASTAANFICTVLQFCTGAVPAFLGTWREPLQKGLFGAIEIVLIPWVMYVILRAWRRRIDHGEPVWFQTMSAGRALATFVGLFIVMAATLPFAKWVQAAVPNPFMGRVGAFVVLGAFAAILAMGMIWIWFCDQPPRTARTLRLAIPAWALLLAINETPHAYRQGVPWNENLFSISANLLIAVIIAMISLALYRLAGRFHRQTDLSVQPE